MGTAIFQAVLCEAVCDALFLIGTSGQQWQEIKTEAAEALPHQREQPYLAPSLHFSHLFHLEILWVFELFIS